jgi:hypothetical protein
LSSFAIYCAIDEFYDYFRDETNIPRGAESVEEYIKAWVAGGAAGVSCSHDATFYFVVVGAIFAHWHDTRSACTDEADWHYSIPWHITRAYKNTDATDGGTEIFDPFYFKAFPPPSQPRRTR